MSSKTVWAERKLQNSENYVISLKKEHNDYSVNRKIVNSYEYHNKFHNITPHKTTNESIYQQSKRILEDRDGSDFERMVVIDYRTGKVITDNITNGTNSKLKTGLTTEQYMKVCNHNDSFVIIHNHPGSTRPSGTDILTLWKEEKAMSSIIVGHDGTVFSISNINRKLPLDKIYEQAYNKAKESGCSTAFAKIKATNALYEANAFDYSEV